jgi:hypothetical protein
VSDELQTSGIALSWETVDWIVPGGVFSYHGLDAMAAIGRVASAVGATVQTAWDSATLRIIPRGPVNPWDLAQASAAVIIPGSAIREMSDSDDPRPLYNGVYVGGEAQGVLGNIVRTGTDGTPYATTVTDPLITHQDVARERGRSILAESGAKRSMRISGPFFPELHALPGQVVFCDGVKGIVTATAIRAERSGISQTLDIIGAP